LIYRNANAKVIKRARTYDFINYNEPELQKAKDSKELSFATALTIFQTLPPVNTLLRSALFMALSKSSIL
jgi:hypothetical protein